MFEENQFKNRNYNLELLEQRRIPVKPTQAQIFRATVKSYEEKFFKQREALDFRKPATELSLK